MKEISDIQLLEEDDDEIEIIFQEEEAESCLDNESEFLDSIPKLDEGSIKMLETTCSNTPVISSTETSNHHYSTEVLYAFLFNLRLTSD